MRGLPFCCPPALPLSASSFDASPPEASPLGAALPDADHDPLTGLANRASLQSAFARLVAGRAPFALLLVDLDHFKLVNDSLGHDCGDRLLVEMGRRFSQVAPGGATVARLGGDEFALLLPLDGADHRPGDQADRLHGALAAPVTLEGRSLAVSCSIGIATRHPQLSSGPHPEPQAYQTISEMLRDGDLAMYRAKRDGRKRTVIFDAAMHASAVARLNLESDLQAALAHDDFVLFLQPIVRLADRRIKGFEVLVRWMRPGHGLVMPSEFISALEDTGQIIQLGQWIIREACSLLGAWLAQRPPGDCPSLSINLSARQFDDPGLLDTICGAVADARVPPSLLRLEVTESLVMQDPEHVAAVLRQLVEAGFGVSLDDFGTGYSSLSYLQSFPFDTLKIDRSFVSGVQEKGGSLRIVRAILGLAGSIGLEVVAEGIEDEHQARLLSQLGCGYGQGYLFSRPMPINEATLLLARGTEEQPGATDSTISRDHVPPAPASGPAPAGRSPRQLLRLLPGRLGRVLPEPDRSGGHQVAPAPLRRTARTGGLRRARGFVPPLLVLLFLAFHANLSAISAVHAAALTSLCLTVGPAFAAAACLRRATSGTGGLRLNWMSAASAFLLWSVGSLLGIWLPMEGPAGAVDFSYFLCSLTLLFALTSSSDGRRGPLSLAMDGAQILLGAFLGFVVIFGAVPLADRKFVPLSGNALLWIYDVDNVCLATLAILRLFGSRKTAERVHFDRCMLLFTLSFGTLGSLYDHIAPPDPSALDVMLDIPFFILAFGAWLPQRQWAPRHARSGLATAFVDSVGPVFMTAAVMIVGACVARQRPVAGLVSIFMAIAIYALRVSILQARYLLTHQELRQARDRLERLALEDELTGVANRRAFNDSLRALWQDWAATGTPFAMLLIDVDYFKSYNDRYGHPAGDACLVAVAQTLQSVAGGRGAIIARHGGEEFAVLLPHSGLRQAVDVASGIREAVASLDLPSRTGRGAQVTVSIGVASASASATIEALMLAADDALYRAKRNGRDCVESESAALLQT